MKITVNYGACASSASLVYSDINRTEWSKEGWLTIIFTNGEKTLVNASKCYSTDIERDKEEEEGDNSYQ